MRLQTSSTTTALPPSCLKAFADTLRRYSSVLVRMCLTAMLLSLSACAGLTGGSLTDDEDWIATGFRYYDSSPYLLVYTDNKGGLNSELKYLPDLTKKRQVKPYQFLASVEGSLTFEDGILTGAESNGDGTAVPKAVISALEKTAKAVIAADSTTRETPAAKAADGMAPRVYLFKIIKHVDDKGQYVWELKGSSGSPIKS